MGCLLLFPLVTQAQSTVDVIKYPAFLELVAESKQPVQVVNFWATWCKPCVIEMPYFVELEQKYGTKVDIFFVSFDQVQDLPRVQSFIKARGIQSPVYILDEIPNEALMNKVDQRWQGAIPLTLIIKNGKTVAVEERAFHSFQEITQVLVPFLR